MEKQFSGRNWRLIGVRPKGTLCHKLCTVYGGGKSEISKSISIAILRSPVFVRDFPADMAQVAEILKMDFSTIYRSCRPILSTERSLGSVIQLLTPSTDYNDFSNNWLRGLKQTARHLVFTVKRYYRSEWGDNWAEHFTVDHVNGYFGHELKFEQEPLVSNYLRVGFEPDNSWRIFKLRPDFYPSMKVQVEDDITASAVLPREQLYRLDPENTNLNVKRLTNAKRSPSNAPMKPSTAAATNKPNPTWPAPIPSSPARNLSLQPRLRPWSTTSPRWTALVLP